MLKHAIGNDRTASSQGNDQTATTPISGPFGLSNDRRSMYPSIIPTQIVERLHTRLRNVQMQIRCETANVDTIVESRDERSPSTSIYLESNKLQFNNECRFTRVIKLSRIASRDRVRSHVSV